GAIHEQHKLCPGRQVLEIDEEGLTGAGLPWLRLDPRYTCGTSNHTCRVEGRRGQDIATLGVGGTFDERPSYQKSREACANTNQFHSVHPFVSFRRPAAQLLSCRPGKGRHRSARPDISDLTPLDRSHPIPTSPRLGHPPSLDESSHRNTRLTARIATPGAT